jgi:hypothetical protein
MFAIWLVNRSKRQLISFEEEVESIEDALLLCANRLRKMGAITLKAQNIGLVIDDRKEKESGVLVTDQILNTGFFIAGGKITDAPETDPIEVDLRLPINSIAN